MPNTKEQIKHLTDCLNGTGNVRLRPMFGEYALYCSEKVVALMCDGKLYLKTTPPGREVLGDSPELPPFPGSKPHLVVTEMIMTNHDAFNSLLQATAQALPAKSKSTRKK